MNHDADRYYIAVRVIDACLREDLHGITSHGRSASPPPAVLAAWPQPIADAIWWRIAHLPDGELWLPLRRQGYLQELSAGCDGWILHTAQRSVFESGTTQWLARMSAGCDAQTQTLHRAYAEEADCAVRQRRLARQAYLQQQPLLAAALDASDAHERAYRCEQLASHRDHPFYPTARAKVGLDDADLPRYAPEFGPSFTLRWLVLPSAQVVQTTPPPAFWPQPSLLGLDPALDASHVAWPLHPLLYARLGETDFALPASAIVAPQPWLQVRPSLSLRTVIPLEFPDHHLKLPVPMRTLGALNLRLIKPSTLFDGHWFECVLRDIAAHDAALAPRYLHVDEAHAGHVGDARHLAYLLRRYPTLPEATLVPVAALCAPMPDGRPLAMHLTERFHGGDLTAWWDSYTALMCQVHLRLWLRYGIALEANQQNSVLIYAPGHSPRLLFKDNDAARVMLSRLHAQRPTLAALGAPRDARIAADDDNALARMFCTIILQLNLQAVLEGLAEWRSALRAPLYTRLRACLYDTLRALRADGIDTAPAQTLLTAPRLPVKYLLSAGSLLGKQLTGATDINKFYGDSAPNLLCDALDVPAPTTATETTP
ncbi:IucA/IucC family protein [Xanthomonas albilineans]|uniref:IucA/IucC family protein n=1 Tax=Xanthomonas albilineans TaxID=29447 RepID=UPI0005F30ADF|nr:IucA/IucC family protein [Xanthomonas albilineans]